MPGVITTCEKCGAQFSWNTDHWEDMPDCPRCGHNPGRRFRQADISDLLRLLEHGDRYESGSAAAELGTRGDRRAVEPLIAAMGREGVKLPAVIALGRLGDERAVDTLMTVLKEGGGPSGAAAESLVKIGSERAIQMVLDCLDTLTWSSLVDVFRAFREKGNSAVPVLVPLWRSPNINVRLCAADALRRLGWSPMDQSQQMAFLATAQSWSELKKMGQFAMDHLRAALLGDGDPAFWKRDAANALKSLGWEPQTDEERIAFWVATGADDKLVQAGAAAVELLIARLDDKDPQFREMAANALGKIADPRAVEPLIAVLKGEWQSGRMTAAKALGAIRDVRAVEPLIAALGDQGQSVREEVAEALGNIGDTRAVEPLIAAYADPVSSVREKVVKALSKISGARVIEPLIAALVVLRDDRIEGRDRIIEPLIAALWDADDWVQDIGIYALGVLKDARAVGPLVGFLVNAPADRRRKAVQALVEIGDPRAVESLANALRSDIKEIRQAAAETLKMMGESAVEPLLAYVNDKQRSKAYRAAAAKVLAQITGGPRPEIEGQKGCFIATACYGAADCPEVEILRKFRDTRLSHSQLGARLVAFYNRYSPPVADVIRRSGFARAAIRVLLIKPAVHVVSRMLRGDDH